MIKYFNLFIIAFQEVLYIIKLAKHLKRKQTIFISVNYIFLMIIVYLAKTNYWNNCDEEYKGEL